MRLRQSVPRSCRTSWKLCTGKSSEVRRVASLRLADSDRFAGATIESLLGWRIEKVQIVKRLDPVGFLRAD